MLYHSCTPNDGSMPPLLGLPTLCRLQNCHKLEQVQRRAARFACHRYEKTASVTAVMNDLKWESLETRRNNQRLTMFYRMQHNMVSFTPADHLFSGRTAEDQVTTKCIKFLTLGPMSTSTTSFQQLYACGTLYLHLWSILIHFSPSKQPSVFITDTDSRDHKPQCVILGLSRDALYWKMKILRSLVLSQYSVWCPVWQTHCL